MVAVIPAVATLRYKADPNEGPSARQVADPVGAGPTEWRDPVQPATGANSEAVAIVGPVPIANRGGRPRFPER